MKKTAKPLSEMTLEESFGRLLVRIEHIGSTAVEGLIAKPTVDILLEADPSASPETVRQTAEQCGYTVMSEKPAPEYRFDLCKGRTPQGVAEKVFHLHIRRPGNWDEIVFRDFFRQNPARAQEYVRLKADLRKRFEHNRDAYTEAKVDFIRACVKEARRRPARLSERERNDR